MLPLLEATNLELLRADRVLARDLSFALRSGEVLRVEGANGAGKTTLLRCLAGLYSGFAGQLYFRGRALDASRRGLLRGCSHFLGHAPAISSALTTRENLRWLATLQRQTVGDEAIDRALTRVGLAGYGEVACQQLSAGQRRRVALARLFVSPAELWLLDEPFGALDKTAVAALEDWISEFAAAGGAVLLTTHHEPTRVRPLRSFSLGVVS